MNFIIAERFGLKILIIESVWDAECHSLFIAPYTWWFEDRRPTFVQMNGMKLKTISEKEGLEMLKQHTSDTVKGSEVANFIKQYEALPF